MGEQSLIPIEILLVEDVLGGIDPVQYILRDSKLFNNITVARNLKEAFKLFCQGDFRIAPNHQILIIFNLPLFIDEDVKAIREITLKGNQQVSTAILINNSMEEFLLKQQKINCLFIKKPFRFENFIKKLFSKFEYGIVISKEN